MTPSDNLERHLADGLASLAGSGAPGYLDDVLRRSGRTRQRHAWPLIQGSVFPARAPHERAGSTTGRFLHMTPVIRYAAVATLAVALGIGIAPIIGSPGPNMAPELSPSVSPVPSRDPAAMKAAWVTGTLLPAPDCAGGTETTQPGVSQVRGTRCPGQILTMSDPRLSGTSDATFGSDTYSMVAGDPEIVVGVGTYEVRNDGGSWLCRNTSVARGVTAMGSDAETNVCVGSGVYEGLSAILVLDWTACQPAWTLCESSPVQVTGAIFPGDPPPSP